jgi:hypothetical protein
MSNDTPPPGGPPGPGSPSDGDPTGDPNQPGGTPPPAEPQWNPQSPQTPQTPQSPEAPPPSYGDYQGQSYGQSYGQDPSAGQPPAYPPPPPGAPGGYGPPPGPQKKSPLAIVSLVTGIIAVIPCCWSLPVFAIAALVTGLIGKKQIDQSQGQIPGRGMALAGIILGAVALVIAVVYWILFAAGVFDDMSYKFETS